MVQEGFFDLFKEEVEIQDAEGERIPEPTLGSFEADGTLVIEISKVINFTEDFIDYVNGYNDTVILMDPWEIDPLFLDNVGLFLLPPIRMKVISGGYTTYEQLNHYWYLESVDEIGAGTKS